MVVRIRSRIRAMKTIQSDAVVSRRQRASTQKSVPWVVGSVLQRRRQDRGR